MQGDLATGDIAGVMRPCDAAQGVYWFAMQGVQGGGPATGNLHPGEPSPVVM